MRTIGYYTHTGFGPQFLTQQVWPGPGNNSFNSFDITRTYLDFKFTPVDDVSMRVTPNMYLTNRNATGDTVGQNSGNRQHDRRQSRLSPEVRVYRLQHVLHRKF